MNNKPIAYIGLVLVLASFLTFVVLLSLDRGSMPQWLNLEAAAWGALAVCVVGVVFGVIGWKTTPGKVAACMGGTILLLALLQLLSVSRPAPSARRGAAPSQSRPRRAVAGSTGPGARRTLGRTVGP